MNFSIIGSLRNADFSEEEKKAPNNAEDSFQFNLANPRETSPLQRVFEENKKTPEEDQFDNEFDLFDDEDELFHKSEFKNLFPFIKGTFATYGDSAFDNALLKLTHVFNSSNNVDNQSKAENEKRFITLFFFFPWKLNLN